jgi:thioredoxin-dependent peroxiredoxin
MSRRTNTRPTPNIRPATSPRTERKLWTWLAVGIPLLFVVGLVVANALVAREEPGEGAAVPPFSMVSTQGTMVDRDDVVGESYSLFYFSMGVGCDGCFAQIPELEAGLEERGIRLVSIMVDPVEAVAWEAARHQVTSPILIDDDRSLSEAMGMLGVYGHFDRPSHSFALVDPEGTVQWVRHYADMFVPAGSFFAELDAA